MIPYARHARSADGPIPNVKVCPVCGEHIVLEHRKDWESFSGIEYRNHYTSKHADDGARLVSASTANNE